VFTRDRPIRDAHARGPRRGIAGALAALLAVAAHVAAGPAVASSREAALRSAIGPEGAPLAVPPPELTARDVTTAVFRAAPGERLDFSGRNLRHLDLSGLDFKGATLIRADLFGADLTGANLAGADLTGVNLNRVVAIRTDFTGARLADATLMRPNVSTTLDFWPAEMPRFTRADMRRIRMTVRLHGADFRGADLTAARMGPHEPRADLSSLPASVLTGCDFSGATLADVDLSRAVLTFSRFVDADMRRMNLTLADLSKADLSGADLTGADLTDANLDEANLVGVTGLDTVRGLDTVKNFDRAVR
jgi:uncharacterized protein YjbI with pentapeptide repeats